MITVIDFYKFGDEHLGVNAALLYIISKQYQNEEVNFYAENEHVKSIQKYLDVNNLKIDNVCFHPYNFRFKKGSGITLILKRCLNELTSLIPLNFKKAAKKTNLLFFFSLSPITSIFFKLFLFRKINTIITLHNEVEFIRLSNSFTRNMLGRIVRLSFRIKRNNVSYLVLDTVIKKNLLQYDFLTSQDIIAIPHPYLYKNDPKHLDYNFPFKIGHIGIATRDKQSFYLFDLAEEFHESIQQKKIKLFLIGKNEMDISSELIIGSGNKEMLERTVFESMINDIHFSIFFYNNIYQLTSSGAILDALNFEKPVIALKNDLFNSIFEKAGNIGFLCDDITGIKKTIQTIADGNIDIDMYKQMQLNMKRYKENNSLEELRVQLFSQLHYN